MTGAALLIIAISTILHAGWNLLVRHGRTERAFTRRMLMISCALGALPMLLGEVFFPFLVKIWPYVLASGICSSVYFFGLIRGYHASDFTIVYPVSRAVPVLLVATAELPLGRLPTPLGWLGLFLVVAGCILAPLTSFSGFHPRAYLNRRVIWMILAGLGTMGYSLIDKSAADVLIQHHLAGPVSALRYTYFFFLFGTIGYLALERVFAEPVRDTGIGWKRPAIAAGMSLFSYALIVWVYQKTGQVSYVVACRQLSIVIGVVAAFVIFKEKGLFVRVTAATLITAGTVIIGMWGM